MTRMKDTIYTSAITSYVKENVLPQDQYKLEFAINFESLCAHLKRVPQFMVHYRSVKKETRRNSLQLYKMCKGRICRFI